MENKTILLIDGENFRKIISELFKKYNKEFNILKFDFKNFFDYVLKDIRLERKLIYFYFSKIKLYKETGEIKKYGKVVY